MNSRSAILLSLTPPILQIRDRGVKGLSVLIGILSTLGEESILTRAARAVANAAQDARNADLLHAEDVVEVLLRVLGDATRSKTKQVIVRALRCVERAYNKLLQFILKKKYIYIAMDAKSTFVKSQIAGGKKKKKTRRLQDPRLDRRAQEEGAGLRGHRRRHQHHAPVFQVGK